MALLGIYGLFAVVAGFGNIFVGHNPVMGVTALLMGAGFLYGARVVARSGSRTSAQRRSGSTLIGGMATYGIVAVILGLLLLISSDSNLLPPPLPWALGLFLIGSGIYSLVGARGMFASGQVDGTPETGRYMTQQDMRIVMPNGDRLGGSTITDPDLGPRFESIVKHYREQLILGAAPFQVFQSPGAQDSVAGLFGLWVQLSANHQIFCWITLTRVVDTIEWSLYGADLRNGFWQGVKSSYFFLKKDNPFVTNAPPGAWNEAFNMLRVLGFDPSGAKDSLAHSGPQSISYAGLDMAERLRERVESLWMASLRRAVEEPQQTAPVVAPPVIEGYEPKPTIKRRKQ